MTIYQTNPSHPPKEYLPMTIATDNRDQLDQNFYLFPARITGQAIRNEIGEDWWAYIIVERAHGRVAVFYWAHLLDALQKQNRPLNTLAQQPLEAIPGLLDAFNAPLIDITTTDLRTAQRQASRAPLKVAIASENGQIVGIITTPAAAARGDVPSVDFNAIPMGTLATAMGGQPEDMALEMAAPSPDGDAEPLPIEPRFMNVELADAQSNTPIQPETTPLTKEQPYILTFFVDAVLSATHIGGADTEINPNLFAPQEEELELTIQLKTDDFAVDTPTKYLYVPRTGRSDRERFTITPLHDGACQLTAVVLKGQTFVQVITLKFHVGPLFTVEALGRTLDSAPKLPPRDVHLTFLPENDGYRVILSGPVAATAHLPINRTYVAHLVTQARRALHQLVHFKVDDLPIYQTRLDIPTYINDQMLIRLANAGYDLFEQLFYGPGHDLQARAVGDALKQLSQRQKLKIQIFSQNFMLPWGMVYLGDDPDQPDPEQFIGLRHIIEHIPLQPNMQVFDHHLETADGLHVGLNMNTDIDAQMGQPIIGRQLQKWEQIAQQSALIKVDVRRDHLSVLEALNNGAPDELMYFYCHAESFDLNEPDNRTPEQSRLIFNNHQPLTLQKLRRNKAQLPGQPLVFINACESAELSPEFYDGFVPYFVNKGARGVIGTECETPALFAEEFAYRFFARFLKAEDSLGEIFLALRREFYFSQNNLLGLVYALYVDGDTRLRNTAVC
jgi:hypothetical protein